MKRMLSWFPLFILFIFSQNALAYQKIRHNDKPCKQGHDPFCFNKEGQRTKLGGEFRQRFTSLNGREYSSSASESIWAHRYNTFLDYRIDKMQTFLELSSALLNGGGDEGSPVEVNKAFVNQALIKFSFTKTLNISLGRQQILLGSERLVSVRNGPNVRRRFDGVVLGTNSKDVDVKMIGLREVESGLEEFDDSSSSGDTLLGIYSTRRLSDYNLEFYLLNGKFHERQYQNIIGEDERYSLGSRFSFDNELYTIDSEFIYQFGELKTSQRDYSVNAYTIANKVTRSFDSQNLKLGLSFNYASGDHDPKDGKISTFNAYFPRGNYFDEVALVGPSNFYNFSPYVLYKINDSLSYTCNIDFFYRASLKDSVYTPSGHTLRRSNASGERHVHTGISSNVDWEISETLLSSIVFSHIIPGQFIRDTGESEHITFIELSLSFQF